MVTHTKKRIRNNVKKALDKNNISYETVGSGKLATTVWVKGIPPHTSINIHDLNTDIRKYNAVI